MNLISLVDGFKARDGEELVPFRSAQWRKLRGQPLRIICGRGDGTVEALRAACANDCQPIDLLDVDNIDYAVVSYDDSKHRKFKAKHGMTILRPMLHHMPRAYAIWLIRQY